MKTHIRKQEKRDLRKEIEAISEFPLDEIKEMHWAANDYSINYINAELLFNYYSNESNFCSALASRLECVDAEENINLIIENFLQYWQQKKEESLQSLNIWKDICDKQVQLLESLEWSYFRG